MQEQEFKRLCVNSSATDFCQFGSNEYLDSACTRSLPFEVVINKPQTALRVQAVAHQYLLPSCLGPFGPRCREQHGFGGGNERYECHG
jgi:hypothetical protein